MSFKVLIVRMIRRFAYYRWHNRVTLLHPDVGFYRFTRIAFGGGANKNNITLDYKSRIYGTLSVEHNGKISVGKYSQLGAGSVVRAVNEVRIGDLTAISTNVIISDNNTHSVNPADRIILQKTPEGSKLRSWVYSENAPIVIGNNCWVGENARICKGVIIGDGAVIAANAVVTKNVPSNSIAAGNPASIVKTNIDKCTRRFIIDYEEK